MEKDTHRIKRSYQLQTKLYHVEDKLVTLGPIGLTLRQCFVLMLGGCGSINVWQLLDGLRTGIAIQLSLASILLGLSALIASVRIADRYSETWLLVLFEYLKSERVYLWRPDLRSAHLPKRGLDSQNDELIENRSEKEQQEDDEYDA